MSGFAATVGRSIQYIDKQGVLNAAQVVAVNGDGSVKLVAFTPDGKVLFVDEVHPYVVTDRPSQNFNRFLLNWQGR